MFLLRSLKGLFWHVGFQRKDNPDPRLATRSSSNVFQKQACHSLSSPSAEIDPDLFLKMQPYLKDRNTLVSLDANHCHFRLSKQMHALIEQPDLILETPLAFEMMAIFSRAHRSDTLCFIDSALEEFYRYYKDLEPQFKELTADSCQRLQALFEEMVAYLSILQQFSYSTEYAHESDLAGARPHIHPSYKDCCLLIQKRIDELGRVVLELPHASHAHGSKRQAQRNRHLIDSIRKGIQATARPIQVYLYLMQLDGGFIAFTVVDFHRVLNVQIQDSPEAWLKETKLRAFILKCRSLLISSVPPVEYEKAMEKSYALIKRVMKTKDHHDGLLALKQLLHFLSLFYPDFFERRYFFHALIKGLEEGSLSVQQIVERTGWHEHKSLSVSQMLYKLKFCLEDAMSLFWSDYERVLQALRLMGRTGNLGVLTFNTHQNVTLSAALQIVLEDYRLASIRAAPGKLGVIEHPMLDELQRLLLSIDHMCEEQERALGAKNSLYARLDYFSYLLKKFSNHVLQDLNDNERTIVLLIHHSHIYAALECLKKDRVNLKKSYDALLDLIKRMCQTRELSIEVLQVALDALEKIEHKHHRLVRMTLDMVEVCDESLMEFEHAVMKSPQPDGYSQAIEWLQQEIKKRLVSTQPCLEEEKAIQTAVLNRPQVTISYLPDMAILLPLPQKTPRQEPAASFNLSDKEVLASKREVLQRGRMNRRHDPSYDVAIQRSGPSIREGSTSSEEEGIETQNGLFAEKLSRNDRQQLMKLLSDPRKMLNYLQAQGFKRNAGHKPSVGSHRSLIRHEGGVEQRITFSTHPGATLGKRALHRILKLTLG